ncbi:MAG: hypothetical protein QXT64_01300 [Desulfurococcaceae archaeon]
MDERLKKMIEEEIERKLKRAPAKQKIARELLYLAEKGVRSPRGGLWTLWEKTYHANSYRAYWYKHAREALRRIPMLALVLRVDLRKLGVDSTLLDEEAIELKKKLRELLVKVVQS